MPQTRYENILHEASHLSPDEQLRLLEALAALLRREMTAEPEYSILDLEGLGADVWQGVDVAQYIEEERNAWKD